MQVLSDKLAPIARACDRSRVLVEQVDLLERQTFRLGDAKVREDDAARTRRAPDEEHLHAEVRVAGARVHQVGRSERDRPVPQPADTSQQRTGGR